jgi:hypothetical protein
MSEQTWSLLVGFGVVVGLRLLDWVLPKDYVWREALKWSVRRPNGKDDPR